MSHQEDNKRLAKNTLVMYLRTFMVLLISLYVSRVLLKLLGVDDYGIYNVVGGIVVLFSFLNSAMSMASQRFITFAFGKGNIKETSQVFSASMITQIIITIILIVVVEILGLWFLNSKLNIPADRMVAANWVFQISILTFSLQVVRVPYEASVIAHEMLGFFAYTSIIDATLKLGIVFGLQAIHIDKLITYSFLLGVETLIMFLIYQWYCKHKFEICKFSIVRDKALYKQLLSYTGWSICGSTTDILTQQGFVFLINIFYGVAVNAAVGISNQVNTAIRAFVASFQTSFRPQIVKTYALQDISHMNVLVSTTSKISYGLMIIPSLILIFNMPLVLDIWLTNVPKYAVEFCQFILICTVFDALSGSFNAAIMATERIRNYQITISVSFALDLVISFLLIKLDILPYFVLLSRIATRGILNMFIGLFFMKKVNNFNVKYYFKDVILPVFVVSCLLISLPIYLYTIFDGWNLLLISSGFLLLIGAVSIYFVLLNIDERKLLVNMINSKIHR
nr:lipopolysaccharide biosynthesis protein [Prevotella sp.]